MGTPDFAVPSLDALIQSNHQVVGVFTQPDKKSGRGNKLKYPPVKIKAVDSGIPVFQPDNLREKDCKNLLTSLAPDIIVVIAYGKILPTWVLELPTYGCINIHASILPKYRGAAPIHWAILNGDEETGVTIMQMDEGMDTGNILHIEKTAILPMETTGELFERLSLLGKNVLIPVINDLILGKIKPLPQEHDKATYTKKIEKALGYINWNQPAKSIHYLIRGLAPMPGAVALFRGKRIKFLASKAYTHSIQEVNSETSSLYILDDKELLFSIEFSKSELSYLMATPGSVIHASKESFFVVTGDGILEILMLQPESKSRMSSAEFIRGHDVCVGNKFDECS